jgi:hypothetical protein
VLGGEVVEGEQRVAVLHEEVLPKVGDGRGQAAAG